MIHRKIQVWNRKGRALRPFLVCAFLLAPALAPAAGSGRLRPPPGLECERNQLTAYSGRVSGYQPGAESTWIQISTDEDTIEVVTVPHRGKPDASARYLLRGEAFTAQDRPKIEASTGKVAAGMRAVAWVCLDAKTDPIIDWQPPQP